jgi:rhodanese-related sulfurtransferase
MEHIDAQTLHDWQASGQDFVLVDTLPPTAFAKAHLPGAIHIMSDDIIARAPTVLPDKTAQIVVYCASENCKRAGLSAQRLRDMGYGNVRHFVGGKRDWLAAGFALVTAETD